MARAKRNENYVVQPGYTPTWTKEYEWDGLQPDAPVKVKGETGDYVFKYVHVKVVEGTPTVTDIIVHGGTNGYTSLRAFLPARVTPVVAKKKRTRKA